MRPKGAVAAALALAVALAVAVAVEAPASAARPPVLTCQDWEAMPLERQAAYVRGIVEGIGLTVAALVTAQLPQALPEERAALARLWASRLIADRSVGAYVAKMTTICRDGTLPSEVPLGGVFLEATQAFRAAEPPASGGSSPASGTEPAEPIASRPRDAPPDVAAREEEGADDEGVGGEGDAPPPQLQHRLVVEAVQVGGLGSGSSDESRGRRGTSTARSSPRASVQHPR